MTLDDSPFPRHEAVTPPPPPDARWLRTPVRAFMRPGVVTVSEDASLLQVQRAMIAHAVHAVLIVGATGPIGWITAGGLLPWLGQEPALYTAASALTEKAVRIAPTASASDALRALADPATSHLVVSVRPDAPPQGVVAELDLVRLASAA